MQPRLPLSLVPTLREWSDETRLFWNKKSLTSLTPTMINLLSNWMLILLVGISFVAGTHSLNDSSLIIEANCGKGLRDITWCTLELYVPRRESPEEEWNVLARDTIGFKCTGDSNDQVQVRAKRSLLMHKASHFKLTKCHTETSTQNVLPQPTLQKIHRRMIPSVSLLLQEETSILTWYNCLAVVVLGLLFWKNTKEDTPVNHIISVPVVGGVNTTQGFFGGSYWEFSPIHWFITNGQSICRVFYHSIYVVKSVSHWFINNGLSVTPPEQFVDDFSWSSETDDSDLDEESYEVGDVPLIHEDSAVDYMHPEVGVTSTDPARFGRNLFNRLSAFETEEDEFADECAELMPFKTVACKIPCSYNFNWLDLQTGFFLAPNLFLIAFITFLGILTFTNDLESSVQEDTTEQTKLLEQEVEWVVHEVSQD